MGVKLIVFIIALLIYIILKKGSVKTEQIRRDKFLVTIGLLLIFQSALRNLAVGPDTYQYFTTFEYVHSLSWDEVIGNLTNYLSHGNIKDPGYTLFVKLFQTIIPDFRCFLFAVALVFFIPLLRLFKYYNVPIDGCLMSLALYQALFYYFFSITGIRQTLATGIALLIVPYALNRKYILFFSSLLLAAMIHKSVLVFGLFYLFPYIKNSRKYIALAFLCFGPMWIAGQKLAQFVIAGTIFDQYEAYLEGYETTGAISFAIFILIVGLLILKFHYLLVDVKIYNTLILAIAFAIFYTPMTSVGPSQMRIVQYFSLFVLLILPIIFKQLQLLCGKNLNLYGFFFFAIYALMKNHEYCFYWEPMKLGSNYMFSMTIVGW